MLRIITTKIGENIVSVLTDDFDIKEFRISETPGNRIHFNIGDIIIGRVANIVRNINSCFVEIFPGIQGYLNLKNDMKCVYANGKAGGLPVINDLILVQILKEPTKTKSYTLTTDFTFMNKYVVLKPAMESVHISSRFKTYENYTEIRQRFQTVGKQFLRETGAGFIARKSACSLRDDELSDTLYDLYSEYISILHRGRHGVKYERIFQEIPPHLSMIRDNHDEIEKVMTDDREVYEEYKAYILKSCKKEENKLFFYEDETMKLANLYSVNSTLERALSKKVWLKSGAYLVIEPTEALTVIDVNSGKAVTGKTIGEKTFFNINLEAAEEIANQLRLRNLSGMILVDFIDVPESYKKILLDTMNGFLKEDSTNACAVDITGLGLMEITRRRSGRPLYEFFRKNDIVY